jgi:hypothetical protein
MILAMPKKITIDNLARMIQEGFSDFKAYVDKKFDAVDERLDNIDTRLDRIEHIILVDHRDRIERLEERAFGK